MKHGVGQGTLNIGWMQRISAGCSRCRSIILACFLMFLIFFRLLPPCIYCCRPAVWAMWLSAAWVQYTRPAGPMERRLTTNQEIAGSTPASVISSSSIGTLFFIFLCAAFGNVDLSYRTLTGLWRTDYAMTQPGMGFTECTSGYYSYTMLPSTEYTIPLPAHLSSSCP